MNGNPSVARAPPYRLLIPRAELHSPKMFYTSLDTVLTSAMNHHGQVLPYRFKPRPSTVEGTSCPPQQTLQGSIQSALVGLWSAQPHFPCTVGTEYPFWVCRFIARGPPGLQGVYSQWMDAFYLRANPVYNTVFELNRSAAFFTFVLL